MLTRETLRSPRSIPPNAGTSGGGSGRLSHLRGFAAAGLMSNVGQKRLCQLSGPFPDFLPDHLVECTPADLKGLQRFQSPVHNFRNLFLGG